MTALPASGWSPWAALIDAAGGGVLALDADLSIRWVNAAGAELLGSAASALVGRRVAELDDRDLAHRLETAGRRVLAGDEAVEDRGDGSDAGVPALLALRAREGVLVCLGGDHANGAAPTVPAPAGSAERLSLGVRIAGLALAEVDYARGETQLDAEAARLFGLGTTAMVVPREVIHATFHPDDHPALMDHIATSLDPAGPGWFAMEHRVRHADGRVVWLRVRKQVEFTGEGAARRPRRALLTALDISAEKVAEDALRASEARLAASVAELEMLYGTAPIGLCVVDRELRFLRINERLAEINGLPAAAHLGRTIMDVLPTLPDVHALYRRVLATGESVVGLEVTGTLPAEPERTRTWLVSYYPVTGSDGEVAGVSAMVLDVTEQRAAERRLEAAQRMETAGRIAGGVAHEANNQMTIVLGAAQLLGERADLGDDARAELLHIERAARRTARICQQLLAFSRQQVLQPEVLRPDAAVEALSPLIGRALGERCTLALDLAAGEARVRIDRGQLEQVLLNLALNARDAMPDGGRLRLASAAVALDAAALDALGVSLPPGDYWLLGAEDNGAGMDDATRARIFEPFFTTKPLGQGRGLGLSMAQGVMRQSGGDIAVETAPGTGTTIRLLLPLTVDPAVEPATIASTAPAVPRGAELLLVEDEPTLRRYAERILRRAGFVVQSAADAEAALALVEGRANGPDCLVTDVMMPGLSGADLAARLRARWPALPVLFVSGHTDVVGDRLLTDERMAFLGKPYLLGELVGRVAALVGRDRSN